MRKKIVREAERHSKECITMLCRLIEKKTINPPGDEYKVIEYVKQLLSSLAISFEIYEKTKGRANLLAYIGSGKPRLFVGCHADVVPAGEGWKTDPFLPVIAEGKIYGRGAQDNKGPLSSLLILAKIFKKYEDQLKGQLIIGVLADEECGSDHGLHYLLEKNRIACDYALIPDIGENMQVIDVAEKGALFIKITAIGKQAHGSRPEEGINAIWAMLRFLQKVKSWKMKYAKHDLLKRPSINLGQIQGGNAPNMVAARCEAVLDIRYLPSQSKRVIIEDLRGFMHDGKASFSLELLQSHKPAEAMRDTALISSLKKNAREITGKEPKIAGLGGHTFAGFFMEQGINAVGFGFGGDVAHRANEYIEIDEMINFTKVMGLTINDIIGGKK